MLTNLVLGLTAAAQIATVLTIFFLYRQIELGRKATQCQLINDLEKEFRDFYGVFAKLKPGGAWHEPATLSNDEIAQLENLASFCEKLKHFLDRRVLDWKTVDLMFRNRFFLIMRNVNVLALVIEPSRDDWTTALALEKKWRELLPDSDPRRRA